MNSTYSNKEVKPLTFEDLKKIALSCQPKETKPLPKGLSWFTKLMAKFGWHRKYEVIILREEMFKSYYNPFFH